MFKVLIADDEPIERQAIRFIISKGSSLVSSISEAQNGRQALALFESDPPDIIFLDIKMPGVDGLETARSMKALAPDTCIVFITAFNQFEYAHEAIRLGVEDFIVKPASEARIIEVLEKIIAKLKNRLTQRHQYKDTKLKLESLNHHLAGQFLHDLCIKGISQDQFQEYLSLLDITFTWGMCGMFTMVLESYPIQINSDYQKKILQKRCARIATRIAERHNIQLLTNVHWEYTVFMAVFSEEITPSREKIAIYLTDVQNSIKNELSLEILAVTGSSFSDFSQAVYSYREAESQLLKKSTGASHPLLIKLESRFLDNLGQLQGEEYLGTLGELKHWIRSANLDVLQKKLQINELITVIRHFVLGQMVDEVINFEGPDTEQAETPDDLASMMNQFMKDAFETVRGISICHKTTAIERVLQFIDDHYAQDISLDDAAKHCGLSSFYLSKLFKKVQHKNFVEYLTEKRLSEACTLLSQGSLSVKQISAAVGYRDSNYFSRVFKRFYLVAPSEYQSNKFQG